jgi:hypothetical protein
VGQKIAKDFGKQGVFFGSIIGVEYDSDDNGKEKPFYVVQYTDGDKEDLNEEEYVYFDVIVRLIFSFVPKDRVYDRRWGGGRCLCRRLLPWTSNFPSIHIGAAPWW